MTRQNTSLQTRLTLLVLGSVLLFGLVAGYESYENAMFQADEMFDAQLAQFAQNLFAVASHTDHDDELMETRLPQFHKYQQMLAYRVWDTNKDNPHLLLRSDNLFGMEPASMTADGFSNGEWQGRHWRYFHQRDTERGLDVLVGQIDEARNSLAREVAWHNIAPFLFGLPVLAIMTLLAIRFGLRSLHKLTESLRILSPDQLRPVSVLDTPREILPLVEALNGLLARIAKTMENERRFTSDASHELRTPIAAMQAQIQAAHLSNNDAERKESLAKAFLGTERMAHLVGQLLTLSRLDEQSSLICLEPVDIAGLTESCCAELGSNALAKNIEIGFSAEAKPIVAGSPDMVRILIRNLLDNAIRYTPQGGRVEAAMRLADGKVELEIADSGVGVDDKQLTTLGRRFNRIDPSAAEGVGLGLSIVQRIAEIHQAKVSFSRATLGGLNVKVVFPPQA
jgi:two-component system sensor histidine kinase QseC